MRFLSPRLTHLRRKNRDLLQQLETNSELLEQRLKVLRQETRSPRSTEKYKYQFIGSPSKKKRDTWRVRNSSKNVASVLGVHSDKSSEEVSDNDFTNLKKSCATKGLLVGNSTPSPAKRIRRPVLVVSGCKKNQNLKRHQRKSTSAKKKLYKPCRECYCEGIVISENSDDETNGYFTENIITHRCCASCKCRTPKSKKSARKKVVLHSHKPAKTNFHTRRVYNKNNSFVGEELQSLTSARDMINYSPQSIFLRRLRRRSRSVRNKLFKDSGTQTKGEEQDSIISAEDISSGDLRSENEGTKTYADYQKCCCKCSKNCPMHTYKKGPKLCGYSKSLSADGQNEEENDSWLPGMDPDKCEVNPLTTDYKLNLPHEEGLKTNFTKGFKVHDCGEHLRVKDLGKYRRMHWFDCHADNPDWCSRNPHTAFNHKCVHRYIVNNRYTAEPLIADHKGRSRCEICLLSEPPQPSVAEDLRGYKKSVVTLPEVDQQYDGCGLTARQSHSKEHLVCKEQDYSEVDYIIKTQLYSDVYGSSRETLGDREKYKEKNMTKKEDHFRLRGGMDIESKKSGLTRQRNEFNKMNTDQSNLGSLYPNNEKPIDNPSGSETGHTFTPRSEQTRETLLGKASQCASHTEKFPTVRLDKLTSRGPKWNTPITAVTIPLSKAGNKRMGSFPPKSRVFRDLVAVGTDPPVRAVRPPAPANSLALRFQKGVC